MPTSPDILCHDQAMSAPAAHACVASRDIALFVFPGFQIQDLGGPLSVFETAANIAANGAYRTHVVSATGGAVASSAGLEVMTTRIRPAAYDTLIVMGGTLCAEPDNLRSVAAQLDVHALQQSRRVASVCTGAFILAAAGWLDGRRATTHWKYAARLQCLYPKVKVDANRIYTTDRGVWTSAGVTAGIDLALAMVEEDLGAEVARASARMLVVYYRRPGNQSQFSAMAEMEPATDRIRQVLAYMRENLDQALTTEQLAAVACLSPRQFGRNFLAETGETPAKAVERLRVELARQRVELSAEPIEIIARTAGFTDPERMRRAFIRVTGHPPQSLRRMAGAGA